MRKIPLRTLIVFSVLSSVSISAAGQKNERGVASLGPDAVSYMDRGDYMFGGTLSVSGHNNSNSQILVIDGVNSDGVGLSIRPMFQMGVFKNVSVGVSAFYQRNFFDLANAHIKIDKTEIIVKDYNYLDHKGGFRFFGRYYLPIGKSARVAFFADAGIEAYFGQGKVSAVQPDGVKGTYQKSWGVNLGVYPGISAYITRNFVMEASLGLLSVGYNSVTQIHNQVDKGSSSTFPTYLMLNPLALSIGAFYAF